MGRPLVNSEAVFYGKFVNAAYAMFKREPPTSGPYPCRARFPTPTNWWRGST